MAAEAGRREVVTTVGVTALAWLMFSSSGPLLPLRWFVTVVHEAGHALVATLVGGDVSSVTINPHGGGLTYWTYQGSVPTVRVVLVSSAGYLGAATVGGVMLELHAPPSPATHVKGGAQAIEHGPGTTHPARAPSGALLP